MITAHVPVAERWLRSEPELVTTSANRNILQPTKANQERRASRIRDELDKTRHSTSGNTKQKSRAPVLSSMLREDSASSGSVKSGRSQLVDLVVEDTQAEETERVRARKEGGAAWNEDEPKHFV